MSAFLPGVPMSGEGDDLDAAIQELIEARRGAADWNDRFNIDDHPTARFSPKRSGERIGRLWLLHGSGKWLVRVGGGVAIVRPRLGHRRRGPHEGANRGSIR